MRYTFRKANNSDYEQIQNLKRQVHDYHVKKRPDFFSGKENPLENSYFESLLNSSDLKIYVIEDQTRVLGYVITKILSFENNPLIKNHQRLFIEDICVDESYRNKGIGKEIFRQLEILGKTENCRYLDLNVWTFNESAIEFYKNIGMNPIMIRMEKEL